MRKIKPAIKLTKIFSVIFIFFTAVAFGSTMRRTIIAKTALDVPPSSRLHSRSLVRTSYVRHRSSLHRRTHPAPFAAHHFLPLVDPSAEDNPGVEDPVVRQAAIEALGSLNASMVVVDPNNGRILTIINQKLAMGSGYQPCSTFKPAVALAALSEGVIENNNNRLRLGKSWYMDLEQSLAHSNNVYFAKLGSILGINKLREYGQSFGFGEQAGWGIKQEPAGVLPQEPPPPSHGGVGKIASFGEGIEQTTFQLVSFVSAVGNGGTLYYLQYPRTQEELDAFEPRVKRKLDIGPWLEPVRQGMTEAVLFGTARRAYQPDMTILGKTGTCSEDGMKLGWFAGYAHKESGLAVAVLQRTTQPMGGGPHAAELAGHLFRKLADQTYFAKSVEKEKEKEKDKEVHIAPAAAIELIR